MNKRKYLEHKAVEEGTGCISSCCGDGESSCIDSTKNCKRCKRQAAGGGEHDKQFLPRSEITIGIGEERKAARYCWGEYIYGLQPHRKTEA